MKIGIIGGGIVGRATARVWAEHCDGVRVWDIDPKRCTHGRVQATDPQDVQLVFVCLPEDQLDVFFTGERLMLPDGTMIFNSQNYVIKSTCPIGTTRRIAKQYKMANLVHSPEFLTERCAATDAHFPAQLVIGTRSWTISDSDRCADLLYDQFESRFPGVPIRVMSWEESEAVKLFVNAFGAAKVSLFNEFRSLADALKLDWDRVLEGILGDGRIGHEWTRVPGPDGRRGFGGRCLPKDLETLRHCITTAARTPCILDAVKFRNEMIDRKEPS